MIWVGASEWTIDTDFIGLACGTADIASRVSRVCTPLRSSAQARQVLLSGQVGGKPRACSSWGVVRRGVCARASHDPQPFLKERATPYFAGGDSRYQFGCCRTGATSVSSSRLTVELIWDGKYKDGKRVQPCASHCRFKRLRPSTNPRRSARRCWISSSRGATKR